MPRINVLHRHLARGQHAPQLARISGDRLAQVTVFRHDTGDWNDVDAGPDGFVRFVE